jgi:hypothetical protein
MDQFMGIGVGPPQHIDPPELTLRKVHARSLRSLLSVTKRWLQEFDESSMFFKRRTILIDIFSMEKERL